MNSLMSKSPIVQELVIRIIRARTFENYGEMHRIDGEIIPPTSKIQAKSLGLKESVLGSMKTSFLAQKGTSQNYPLSKSIPPQFGEILPGYGRLTPLIEDPSVSSIEFTDIRTPIKIITLNRVINTNIFLSLEEASSILKYISQRTRIPATNHVFKVAIDGLLFNAISSEELGTKFLIRKNFQISPNYSEAFR